MCPADDARKGEATVEGRGRSVPGVGSGIACAVEEMAGVHRIGRKASSRDDAAWRGPHAAPGCSPERGTKNKALGAHYDFPEHQRGDKDKEYRESALEGVL